MTASKEEGPKPGPDQGPRHDPRHGKKLTIVAALARNRAIGLEGGMPWHLPGELAHFKRTTMGKSVLMGRRTWEAIGRALPGRQNIVLTRSRGFRAEGCEVAGSLGEALRRARSDEVMIIGGASLYARALPLAERMVLTHVDCEAEADTFFPRWDENEWQPVNRVTFKADANNPHGFQVVEYRRKPGG